MEQKLKNTLPGFNINNASCRNIYEIMKITKICHKIDKLIVFIERNATTDDYFKEIESSLNTEEINLIFLNKDNIYHYYIENDNDLDITIMSVKRKISMETDCVICMEQCVNNYMLCGSCGHQTHGKCFAKCDKKICPICKSNKFMYNK
jgi:hypothetical protein